jgi:succinate dehydrogenase / fumarate reductase, cytochrome b subunit
LPRSDSPPAAAACAGQEANLPVRYVQYRGGEGMLAWALHRISGVAVWAFILLHVLDIWLVGANPDLYNEVLALYASPVGRVGETLVGAGLLYHALNGLRIIVMDFWPSTTVWHKQLWYACWVIFFVVGIPGAYIILSPIWTGAH